VLEQIGLAALQHEEHYGWFPTGGWGPKWAGDPNLGYGLNQPGGFFYNILPFMDQASLWAYGQSGQTGNTVLQAAKMPVVIFNCPSRRPLGLLPIQSSVTFYSSSTNDTTMTSITPPTLCRCDYAACGGDTDKGAAPPTKSWPTSSSSTASSGGQNPAFWNSFIQNQTFNGICAPHSQIKGGSISRGRSVVFMVGEKYLDPDNYLNGLDPGDNATWDMGFDVNTIRWAGSKFLPTQDTPGLTAGSNTFGSTHVSGFNMVFGDGSVHTLNFTIDPVMYGYLADRNLTTDPADLMDDSKW
jgi:hypothetical protein